MFKRDNQLWCDIRYGASASLFMFTSMSEVISLQDHFVFFYDCVRSDFLLFINVRWGPLEMMYEKTNSHCGISVHAKLSQMITHDQS